MRLDATIHTLKVGGDMPRVMLVGTVFPMPHVTPCVNIHPTAVMAHALVLDLIETCMPTWQHAYMYSCIHAYVLVT